MSQAQSLYSPEQYLARERGAPFKSEFVHGVIYAMSGASREHNLITANLTRELTLQLRGRPCETYSNDMRVRVEATGAYVYPDVVVVCGEPDFEDAQVDTLINPTVLIEVLSPSTEAFDRGAKLAHYRRIPSLRSYLLVAQDRASVEQYARRDAGPDDPWLYGAVTELTGSVALDAIGCALRLSDIYERVALPPGGTS